MTNYLYLTCYSGTWSIEGKQGVSYYIVCVKQNNCKPMVLKCDKTTYDGLSEFKKNDLINLVFNEKQVACGVTRAS